MVLEGPSAIAAARQVIGATNPLEAAPGSIRGDLAIATGENLVHGSDGPAAAEREIGIFFPRAMSELVPVREPTRSWRRSRRSGGRSWLLWAWRSRCAPSGFVEVEEGEAEEVALHNALGKATAVARHEGEVVVAVDTVVSLDGRLWGKPADEMEARATLAALSGRTHTVVSAVAVCDGDGGAAQRQLRDRRHVARALDGARSSGTCVGVSGASGPGAMRSRGLGARSCARSRGTGPTWSGLPVGTLLELLPRLLIRSADIA